MRGEKVVVYCALILISYIALCCGQNNATNNSALADPNKLNCTVYNVTLKLPNVTFNDDLVNAHSPEFIQLRTDFEVGILQVYDGYQPFIGVTTLKFSKAPDGKAIVHFCLEFSNNGSHLPNLTQAITTGQLGKLTPVQVAPKLGQAACYKEPAPPVCPIPCPSACAPTCYSSCCQQGYQQTFYIPPPPPPPPIPPPLALPAPCPAPCPPTCAAAGCSPACCNTMYRQQPHVNYGKRHRTPKPAKGDKKHHISLKRHRKN